uniref:hypothetical protein n=1 Tax=uncultured Nitrospira sp. TaxID=157176 RepID=UPI003140AB63
GQTGRQWFWPLLPKQKWLACRGETRQHKKSRQQQTFQNFISNDPTPAAQFPDRTLLFLAGLSERRELARHIKGAFFL